MTILVEFRDSVIAGIEISGDEIALLFSHAYTFSRCKGWSQTGRLVFKSGTVEEVPEEFPQAISEARLEVGGRIFDSTLAIPFSAQGDSKFEAIFTNGPRLLINGINLKLELPDDA